jgi:hypothetical protein
LHGDGESEKLLSEIVGASAYPNQRHGKWYYRASWYNTSL